MANPLKLLRGGEVKEAFVPGKSDDERRALKEAMKEAIKEWLDEKFAIFGKWSLSAFGAALFAALTYVILRSNGWHR